jgi:hypothetical protein
VLGAANAHVMTPRTVNAIPTANTSLAGFGFGAMYPSWRQIDVAMPDFRGADWKKCMSYFTHFAGCPKNDILRVIDRVVL